MPNPIQALNTGVNFSAAFTDDRGTSFTPDQLGHLISVTASSKATMLESKPLTNKGRNIYVRIPGSYAVDFEFDRYSGALWSLVAAMDQDYYAGNPQRYWDVQVTVTNPDGSTDTYLFKRGVFHTETEGPWQKDQLVRAKFSMEFVECVQMDGNSNLIGVATR